MPEDLSDAAVDAPVVEEVPRRPWPDERPPPTVQAATGRLREVMATTGDPTLEECDAYIKATAAQEKEARDEFPEPPKAPAATRVLPFGHLRTPVGGEDVGFRKGFLN